jgi:hypothetical protein
LYRMPRGVYSRILFAPRRVARIARVNSRVLLRGAHPSHCAGGLRLNFSAFSCIFLSRTSSLNSRAKIVLLTTTL